MPGLYDLFPEGALSNLGIDANANQVNPQMNQGAPQGILNDPNAQDPRLKALGGLGRMLMIAGAQDPAKAAVAFQQNELSQADERRKVAEDKKKKFAQIGKTPFFSVQAPDGTFAVVDDAGNPVPAGALQNYLLEQQKREADLMKNKIDYTADANVRAAGGKQDIKDASEARPQLQQSQQMLEGWTKAKEVVEGQAKNSPWMSKVQGALPGVAGFLGGDEVAANKFLQGLAVDETLLNTARTKGAISDKEMALFKSPIPSLSDDREKVWKPYVEQRIPVIEKLIQFQQGQVDRGTSAATGASRFVVPGLSEGASKYFSK
jgi:hypothetical protein